MAGKAAHARGRPHAHGHTSLQGGFSNIWQRMLTPAAPPPPLLLLQALRYLVVFQHMLLLPMWTFVVFRFFLLI